MNLTRKTYNTSSEKVIDFVIGFVGWWVVNALIVGLGYLILMGASSALANADPQNSALGSVISLLSFALNCLPLLINIGAIVFFAFTRHWIALGLLGAFGLALLAALCLAVLFGAACFALLAAYR